VLEFNKSDGCDDDGDGDDDDNDDDDNNQQTQLAMNCIASDISAGKNISHRHLKD
jgi:hypothetical protein